MASSTPGASSRTRGSTRWCSTTSRAATSVSTRARTRSRSSPPPARTGSRAPPRPRWPPPSSTQLPSSAGGRSTTPRMEPSGRLDRAAAADLQAAAGLARRVAANVARAVEVRDEVLEQVVMSLAADGHVLIEDYPGVGKTALARALARSIGGQFARVQCTPDLLPADIVGANVYNQREQRF